MPSLLPALLALVGLSVPAEDAVQIRASLAETALTPGASGSVSIALTFADGAAASAAGLPAPVLQLDVPDGLILDGPYLTTAKELGRNDHLQYPYERYLQDGLAEVSFTVGDDLAADARLGLIVSGYVTTADDAFFLRRRLELPLVAGAEAVEGDHRDSSWGADQALLRIGSRAPAVSVPGPDGATVDLGEHLGSRNLIVVTYRAFW